MIDFADFVVTAPDDRTQLVVEAKGRTGAGPAWAAALRRNLFAHAALPDAPYFLLALPDRFYLWKDAPAAQLVAPQYAFDARPELAPYLRALRTPAGEVSEEGFELLVQAWLSDLLASLGGSDANPDRLTLDEPTLDEPTLDEPTLDDRRRWLVESGLADALRRGRLHTSRTAPVG